MEPVSLKDVLKSRGKKWAKTQQIHSSALEQFNKIKEFYKEHFLDLKGIQDGWVVDSNGNKEWKNVIYCPDFSPSGEMIYRKRSKTSQMYKNLHSTIQCGFVHPHLQICKIVDSTHPIRFATPPEDDCYTAIYTGPEIFPKNERVVFGEYTGLVLHNSVADQQRFEYVFDLSFNTHAWPYKSNTKNNSPITLPPDGDFILDSSSAFNELSLVNHYQVISLFGNVTMIKNCEWQQIFFDGWPHVVLTSIPGIGIKPGDELLADFGNEWFTKVTEMSHKLLARELLEYRMGIRKSPVQNQKLTRNISFIDKSLDPLVKDMDDPPCAICNTHKNGEVISNSQNGDANKNNKRDKSIPSNCKSDETNSFDNTNEKISTPKQVFCDGCDRLFHTSCLKEVIPSFDAIKRHFGENMNISINSGFPTFIDPLDKWFCYYCRRLALDIIDNDNRMNNNVARHKIFIQFQHKIAKSNAKAIASPFSKPYFFTDNKCTRLNNYNSDSIESGDTIDSIDSNETKLVSTSSIESALSSFYDKSSQINYNQEFNSAKYIFGEVFENPFNTFGNRIKVCKQCIASKGELASVFVCRVVKRHLAGNHDHPHNLKSLELKEMLLEFFQQHIHFYIRLSVIKNIAISYLCSKNEKYFNALNDLFTDNIINTKSDNVLKRRKMVSASVFENIGGVKNEINAVCKSHNLLNYINNIISNNWYLRDEFYASNNDQPQNNCDNTNDSKDVTKKSVNGLNNSFNDNKHTGKEIGYDKTSNKATKRFIPLLGVWIGETSILKKFEDGYYQGIVTDYNDEIEDYTTVFKISYADGDEEYMQPENLASELIENIACWKQIIRKIHKEEDYRYLDTSILNLSVKKLLSGLVHPRFDVIREL